MNKDYKEEYEHVSDVKASVLGVLSGQSQKVCLDQEPTRKYSIGILSPLPQQDAPGNITATKRRPNAIGLEVIVQSANPIEAEILVEMAVYWRALPTWREQSEKMNVHSEGKLTSGDGAIILRQKYIREEVKIGPLLLKIDRSEAIDLLATAINEKLEYIAKECALNENCWPEAIDKKSEISVPLAVLENEDTYKKFLSDKYQKKAKPSWSIGLSLKKWTLVNDKTRIALLMNNAHPDIDSRHPNALHSCRISMQLLNSKFLAESFVASVSDYRYQTNAWGRGVNAVLEVLNDATLARTQTTPEYIQPRTITREEMDEACKFENLCSEKWLDKLKDVGVWLDGYAQRWYEDNKLWKDHSSSQNRISDFAEYELEVARYRQGIAALESDPKLALAFRFANQSFMGKHQGWRLFQLVFVVTQMPALLAREKNDQKLREMLERVDVLWFPTGGGKTEAYFGVIATALFYDRMRGKSRGTTAWLRYPLRMLSIQQLQRLMDIVVAAEKIRKASKMDNLLKGDNFSLGYYVGEKNTPNDLTFPSKRAEEKDEKIRNIKAQVENAQSAADIPVLVLQRCSFCNSDRLKVDVDVKKVRIRHVCGNCSNELPIYISDSEIYRYAPSIVVGTVDRLARAGQTSKFSHIFGQFTHKCPDHGYLSGGECVERAVCTRKAREFIELTPLRDPTPALLLQDELHLLKESLGTYDSHYETFVDTFSARIGNSLPPKRLAATATIEGYKTHIRELYQRDAVRFPVKGMGEFDSAYVTKSIQAPTARLYVGIMPTGAGVDDTVTSILNSIKEFSEAAYSVDEKEHLITNYDLALAYVNQKNAAGNIRASWMDSHEVQVLTGDKGLSEVRSTIARVESDEGVIFEDRLKILIATSIISHGVDLERLNSMAFAGFPSSAADYIQASSRVGRTHVGIVFTVFKPESNRERSIYQRFYEYHERLYQLVQPVPINRLSKPAISRTLSGIMSSSILNILGSAFSRKYGKSLEKAEDFMKALTSGDVREEDIIALVQSSVGLSKASVPKTSLEMMEKLVIDLVKAQLSQISRNEDYKMYSRMRPKPISSLREAGLQLRISPSYSSSQKIELIMKGRK